MAHMGKPTDQVKRWINKQTTVETVLICRCVHTRRLGPCSFLLESFDTCRYFLFHASVAETVAFLVPVELGAGVRIEYTIDLT